jgi:hypothetical protein
VRRYGNSTPAVPITRRSASSFSIPRRIAVAPDKSLHNRNWVTNPTRARLSSWHEV